MERIRKKHSSGFTLMEITIAIVLLAGALTVLLGLQSSITRRTIDDTNKLRAMMYARQILASIESAELPPEELNFTGSLKEAVEQVGTLDPEDEEHFASASDMEVSLKVEAWGIPKLSEDAMKRVVLIVAWGEGNNEQIQLYYYIPKS